MEIKLVGSQPSAKGPAEYFTGTVRVDPLFQAPDPAFVSGAKRHVRTRRTGNDGRHNNPFETTKDSL